MIDKKGALGDQLIMFAFMFLLVVVGGGIAISAYLFIGPEFDFRGIEANLLNYKIGTCITDNSVASVEMRKFWLDELKSDEKSNISLLAEKCNLNKEVIERNNLIRICRNEMNSSDCIGEQDAGKIVLSRDSDFIACGLTEGNKFLGCDIEQYGQYIVITTSKQKIMVRSK